MLRRKPPAQPDGDEPDAHRSEPEVEPEALAMEVEVDPAQAAVEPAEPEVVPVEAERDPGAPDEPRERDEWGFAAGSEIAPGRTVLKSLGGGRRYEVFLVWDERLFALTVAKVIRPSHVDDERALRELRQEAEALERLAHPVLVRGFDAVLEGPHPHVLIEHLEGPTLGRLIRHHGALPMEQLVPLALHVAAALHYVAGEGWVHLDVKPDNILMGIPPRLIDLSIARPLERATRLRGWIGTDAYMPPEQCDADAHRGEIGAASDVWGLGATLHHAVAGTVPFPRARRARESPDPHTRFPQLVAEPRPLPQRTPEPLRELIGRALAKRPTERPTASEFALGLESLVAALPRKLALGRRGARGAL
jgi:serine/threonine protein kinase